MAENKRHWDPAKGQFSDTAPRGGRRKKARTFNRQARGGVNHTRTQSVSERPNFREERIALREQEPPVPQDLDIRDLDSSVRQDLRPLSKENADRVAKHLIMAAQFMEEDPQLALEHARAAKNRAGRVSVVRETLGIVAYRAGEWKEALTELRAARRISGGPGLLAVMADAERGLGNPRKALELANDEHVGELDADSRIELAIVLAGARQDLRQYDAAVAELDRVHPDRTARGVTAARLIYAYAQALGMAGRKQEAREWYQAARQADEEEFFDDIDERLKELDQ